ncbi:maestro heat-like repeat family member 2A [Cricetulus griseus]
MEKAATKLNEDMEETEHHGPLEPEDDGTFFQVTNLLNIMDSESTKTDTTGPGLDMRKTLASVIITEKATTDPCVVMNALIRCLQMPETSTQRKMIIYNILQEIIQQEGELEEHCVQRLVAIASKEMRDTTEMEGFETAEVASETLVALSRNHFSLVMYELQHHLKPLNLTDEFVIVTLAKLANGNVFEFMPYMGITLATIFTMLRLANEAKMRQVICSAMETFCETVQFYLRHLEDSLYPVMTEDQFAVKLFPMYRYFVTVWLRHQDLEVKLGVIKSLRPMLSLLLPNDDLREQVYDYIPLLLAEFQGGLEALFITQVLRQILEASVTTSTPIPPMLLHPIFTELHVQVCTKAPAQQQFSSQNLMEIVHCFIALARSYPKELMKFFFSQVEMSKEAIRVGTLALIRAVVSADDPKMNIKTIYLAIRVVKNTLSDTRSKVRMAILRIIGQLVLSGFQEKIKGWGLKYVSVQLTLSTYKLTNRRECFYQRDLEEKMVHKVTMDTVKIITSSISGMTNEFWVRLLCYIMETDYTEALTPICISLTNLAENQIHGKDTEAGMAGKSKHVDLPAPQKLLARLLVLMSSPYKGEGRGIAMLNLLRTLSQSIAPSMADMWEQEIPLLVQYLEAESKARVPGLCPPKTSTCQFLRNSLKKTRGTSWSLRLSKELNNQIETFDSPSLEKGFLYRALGFTLGMGLEADRVEVLLLELLYKTDYSNDFDREGVILCFGLCARGQVKTVLNVLHDFEERIQESEQSWQIGAWRDISLKMAFMKSVVEVTNAIKSIKDLEEFQFTHKSALTSLIVAIIKAEPPDHLASPVRSMAMDALSKLSTLKPFYSSEESIELMDISIHTVISLQPPGEDNDSIKTLYANALNSLKQLMEGLLQRQLDPKGLQETVHVAEILGAILVHLPVVDHPEVRRHLIEGILLLAHYHQETVLTSLLRQPLPMESHLTEVWLAVAENVPFARTMLHGLLGRLQSRFTARINATSKADIWRLAAVDPLMTLCTIRLLMEKMDQDDKFPDLFPDLLYTFLLQLGSSHGPEAASPVLKTWRLVHTGPLPQEMTLQRITIKSMQLLVKRINREPLEQALEEQSVWSLLENGGTFLEGLSLMARLCLQNAESYTQRLAELVLTGMGSEVLSCCISSTAICVEVRHPSWEGGFMSDPVLHQEKLLRPVVLMLEKGAGQDKDEILQVLSLRALGNMALGAPRKVKQYRKLLLEKCLGSLQGQVSCSVMAEGMEALTKILAELREGDIGSSFEPISQQCRAFFDNESELIRLKAFILFGKLAKVVGISKKHFFKGEVKRGWVSLMLHCQDPCPSVAQAQKKPIVLCGFLVETTIFMKSNLSSIRISACALAALQDLQLDSDAGVRRAALETLKVLDSCNQHWLLASPRGLP